MKPTFGHTFRALAHANFRRYFAGQSVSLIGTWLQQVAMGWLTYRLSGSALLLGVVAFCANIFILLLGPWAGVLADRVAPLAALFTALAREARLPGVPSPARGPAAFAELRLETPDTNDGKELSGLCRAIDPPLAAALIAGGTLVAPAPQGAARSLPVLHVFFADGANAYVGASVPPWGSRWTMGIPRLRMPQGAPSRSTLKLAEAIQAFLGDQAGDLLRGGMKAVDLGAAPGGWTWQLVQRGLRVTAVDNGPLKGEVADPANTPPGCHFHPRCRYAQAVCSQKAPVQEEIAPSHFVSCHRASELSLRGVARSGA